MAQPNYEALNRGLTNAAQQLSLFPNVPAFNPGARVLERIGELQRQQQEQHQQQQQQLRELQETVQAGFQRLETRMDAT
jgi:hypothetical protein